MYELTIVYNDFKTYKVEVEEAELDKLLQCIRSNTTYFDESKIVGFWLPPNNLRCLYVNKKNTQLPQEEPCHQENPSSDLEQDLTN